MTVHNLPSTSPGPSVGPLEILIVDDEQQVREVISELLAVRGHHTHLAGSAREAMSSLRNIKADIAILDVCMPRIDGLELAVMIRGSDPTVHIIMMSGRCTEEAKKAAEELGIETFVNKPFRLEAIDATVNRIGHLVKTGKLSVPAT